MKISSETTKHIAELARLRIPEEKLDETSKDLEAIITYFEVLNTADTEGIEELSHVVDIKNVLREDEIRPSYDREQILQNAPKHDGEMFIVPKIIE